MLNASLLSILEEAGVAVLTLTEGLEADEFLASRLTRAETARQLPTASDAAGTLPPQVHALLAEIDWDGWQTIAQQVRGGRRPPGKVRPSWPARGDVERTENSPLKEPPNPQVRTITAHLLVHVRHWCENKSLCTKFYRAIKNFASLRAQCSPTMTVN